MISNDDIKALALANGFKLKEQPDGAMELNPYVYEFAHKLIANAFQQAAIPKSAKAGCIGEFRFVIENGRVCPACYNDGHSKDCELCNGESGEDGAADLTVTVPWDTCKVIWQAMNKYAAMELRQRASTGTWLKDSNTHCNAKVAGNG